MVPERQKTPVLQSKGPQRGRSYLQGWHFTPASQGAKRAAAVDVAGLPPAAAVLRAPTHRLRRRHKHPLAPEA